MEAHVDHALDSYLAWLDQATFLGAPLGNILKFAAFVSAGFILGRLIRIPVARWLEKATPESDHHTSVRVSAALERSLFLLIFALVLKTGAIDVLHLPGWAWEKSQYAITVLIAIASTILFLQMVELGLFGLRKKWQMTRSEVDDHLINFLRKGIRIFIIIVAALVTADNIGFKVTGAIAGLGIGGIAVGLAAQGLIANILGTVEVVADRLYRVGDRIHFDSFDGFVTDVGLRSTEIRSISGETIHVPNKKMAEVQIRNYSRNGLVRTSTPVGVTYSTTHDQVGHAMRILEEVMRGQQNIRDHQIFLKQLGAYSLDLEIVFWAAYKTSSEFNDLMGRLHMEIKRRFDEARLEFAFPTQTLHVTQAATSK